MAAIIVMLMVGLLALAFVLYPLYRDKRKNRAKSTDDVAPQVTDTDPLQEEEQSARAALREVELDYQLGNIAEPDYRALRERYMQRALLALKSRFEREQEIDEAIEEQLRQMKEGYEKADR